MDAKKICGTLCGVHADNRNLDLGLLLLRLALAAAFIFHGWAKVSAMDGTVSMFASMGVGSVITYIAAYVEFLGGIALLAGIMTRLVGGLLAIFMIVAIYLVHLSKGYSMMNGGYEYQLLLLVGVVVVALVGPGKYSLHENFCKKMK